VIPGPTATGNELAQLYRLVRNPHAERLADESVQWLEGVLGMQESTTYQAILKEGRQEGLVEGRNEGLIEGRITGEQRLLVRQGTKRFGEPDATTLAAIEAIRDIERLEALGLRIVDSDVHDWNNLLGAP
jgi:predicted transposase YdaD